MLVGESADAQKLEAAFQAQEAETGYWKDRYQKRDAQVETLIGEIAAYKGAVDQEREAWRAVEASLRQDLKDQKTRTARAGFGGFIGGLLVGGIVYAVSR